MANDDPDSRPLLKLGVLHWQQFAVYLLGACGGGILGAGLAIDGLCLASAMGAAMLMLAALMLVKVQYRLVVALQMIDQFALDLAAGRLITRLDTGRCGLLAPLAERLNGMARSLSGAFLNFARMSQEISSVAGEGNTNAIGGNDGVRRQRDITHASSATLEQLTVSLGMTSESAQGAAQVADASGCIAWRAPSRWPCWLAGLKVWWIWSDRRRIVLNALAYAHLK